jgi:hypothetical protein
VRAKNNLAAKGSDGTLAYKFREKEVGADKKTGLAIMAPYIQFEADYVDVTATEAMHAAAENKSPGTRDRAKTLLRDLLANEPMPQKEIAKLAKQEGFSVSVRGRVRAPLILL